MHHSHRQVNSWCWHLCYLCLDSENIVAFWCSSQLQSLWGFMFICSLMFDMPLTRKRNEGMSLPGISVSPVNLAAALPGVSAIMAEDDLWNMRQVQTVCRSRGPQDCSSVPNFQKTHLQCGWQACLRLSVHWLKSNNTGRLQCIDIVCRGSHDHDSWSCLLVSIHKPLLPCSNRGFNSALIMPFRSHAQSEVSLPALGSAQ